MRTLFTNPPGVLVRIASGLAAACMLFTATPSSAQIFNPAFGTEYIWPTAPGPVNQTTHSFTYTISHIDYMYGPNAAPPPGPPPPPAPVPPYVMGNPWGFLTDLTVHSWGDPGGTTGFSYISTQTGSGTPGIVYDQGNIIYPAGVQNIELSLQQEANGYAMYMWGTSAPWYVIASYYNPAGMGGPGHYVDVYVWNKPPPYGAGGLTLISTTQLSTIPFYTRISQDAHNTYGFAIAWHDPNPGPNQGINYMMGFMNNLFPGVSMSPVYVLPGTNQETNVDVTMDHGGNFMVSNGLQIQFVYYTRIGAGNPRITESTVPFIMGPAWPIVGPAPAIRDINMPPVIYPWTMPMPDLQTRMDEPDHGVDNFAYSYILPANTPCGLFSNEIYVRYMNTGIPATLVVTDGSMGNAACDINPAGVWATNNRPVVSFEQNTNLVDVEWYTTYQNGPSFFMPNVGGYLGMQFDITTGGLTSPLDYRQVGELASTSNAQASGTPTIASSRQNDRTDYQYVAFANFNAAGWGNEMHVKDRIWGAPLFKTTSGGGGVPGAELYPSNKNNPLATGSLAHGKGDLVAYPNPFKSTVSLDIPAKYANDKLTIRVEDVAGKLIQEYTGAANLANAFLSTVAPKLTNGTYLIKVSSIDGDYNDVVKVQKLDDK